MHVSRSLIALAFALGGSPFVSAASAAVLVTSPVLYTTPGAVYGKSWSTSGDADDRPTEEVAFNYRVSVDSVRLTTDPNDVDSDGDGRVDWLDPDDDGDGLPTDEGDLMVHAPRVHTRFDLTIECLECGPGGAPLSRIIAITEEGVEEHVENLLREPCEDCGYEVFRTETSAADLFAPAPPELGLPGVRIRNSTTRPSTGRHTVERLAGGGALVDSYFDLWTEVSLDDGATWTEFSAPIRVELVGIVGAVPEPGAAAIGGLAALAGAFGRRKANLFVDGEVSAP